MIFNLTVCKVPLCRAWTGYSRGSKFYHNQKLLGRLNPPYNMPQYLRWLLLNLCICSRTTPRYIWLSLFSTSVFIFHSMSLVPLKGCPLWKNRQTETAYRPAISDLKIIFLSHHPQPPLHPPFPLHQFIHSSHSAIPHRKRETGQKV